MRLRIGLVAAALLLISAGSSPAEPSSHRPVHGQDALDDVTGEDSITEEQLDTLDAFTLKIRTYHSRANPRYDRYIQIRVDALPAQEIDSVIEHEVGLRAIFKAGGHLYRGTSFGRLPRNRTLEERRGGRWREIHTPVSGEISTDSGQATTYGLSIGLQAFDGATRFKFLRIFTYRKGTDRHDEVPAGIIFHRGP